MANFECECFNCDKKFIVTRSLRNNKPPRNANVRCPHCKQMQTRNLAWDKQLKIK